MITSIDRSLPRFVVVMAELGNASDIRRLYVQHAASIRRLLLRLGTRPADADDLVQEVFLIAWRKGLTIEGPAAPTTWLYSVAVKVVSSWRRRARIRQLFGLDAADEPVISHTPERALQQSEARTMVLRLLGKIAEKKRTVFVLYELEELSGQQIAEILGCPIKTVWTRLHHARKEFKEHLEREESQQSREQLLSAGRAR